jgi:tetratricopeptide (TPR) repeat protein
LDPQAKEDMDDGKLKMASSGDLSRLAEEAVEHFQRGNLNAAKEIFREVETVSRTADNGLRLQEALMYQGLILFQESDLEGALERFKEQESICRELELRPYLVMSLGNQALVLAKSGEWEKSRAAQRLFEEIERMCREEGELWRTLINKGDLLYDMEFDHARAKDVFKQSVEVARKLGDKEKLCLAMFKEAECLGWDEIPEARRLCEEALPLAKQAGSPDLIRRIEELLDCLRNCAK